MEELGVEGVADVFPVVKLVMTGPRGGGSFVAELADPGRTTGFESEMLGLSAYRLIPPGAARPWILYHCGPALEMLDFDLIALDDRKDARSMTAFVERQGIVVIEV